LGLAAGKGKRQYGDANDNDSIGGVALREASGGTFVEVERASARVRPVVAQPSRPEATSLEPIEIITPSGLRVRLPSKFDVDVLRRVLAVVH